VRGNQQALHARLAWPLMSNDQEMLRLLVIGQQRLHLAMQLYILSAGVLQGRRHAPLRPLPQRCYRDN
jgi:hypothetical protein